MTATLSSIFNFIPLSETIATAGQPTESQFALLKDAGFKLVINLAMPNSTNAIPQEQAIVESQGMQYVHIPVVWENPTLEDFAKFVETMQSNEGNLRFVHCAMNMRVSVFLYLYRRLFEGVDETEAQQAMQQVWTPNETWQAFIDVVLQHYGAEAESRR